ncbi:MAG TPA: EAL domain-containing protein, partial [Spongiibacteraceae bacterium]
MKSTDTVSGIIDYLNQHDLRAANSDWRERPLYIDEDGVNASYAGFKLGSLFQPIVTHDKDRAHVVAYEALLAVHAASGSPLHSVIEPEALFLSQPGNKEITLLDRLARTLHALNFLLQDVDGALHLNVHPLHVLAVSADHGLVFEKILRQCGLEPTSITLEIPEHHIRDKHSLHVAIREWQSRGYKIAIDQFGEKHFTLERVLELEPNVIKLAPALAEHAVDCMPQRDKDKIA